MSKKDLRKNAENNYFFTKTHAPIITALIITWWIVSPRCYSQVSNLLVIYFLFIKAVVVYISKENNWMKFNIRFPPTPKNWLVFFSKQWLIQTKRNIVRIDLFSLFNLPLRSREIIY